MMNRHGLSRAIPAAVKRKVRQHCGFGCVVCGLGIVEYEHVDPEYNNARQHESDKIALLCPQCHSKVTKGFWSKEKIKQAMKDPFCKKSGSTTEEFDFCDGFPILQFGGVLLKKCPIPIEVAGTPLFKVDCPEIEGGQFRLSGNFCDLNGDVTLKIIENEWIASANSWDIEVVGPTIIIREAHGRIHLKLIVEPPNKLIVDCLDMNLNGWGFKANGDFLRVTFPDGGVQDCTGFLADDCPVGISFQ